MVDTRIDEKEQLTVSEIAALVKQDSTIARRAAHGERRVPGDLGERRDHLIAGERAPAWVFGEGPGGIRERAVDAGGRGIGGDDRTSLASKVFR